MSDYVRMTAPSYVVAIRNITEETGYPPTPEELAAVFGVSVRSLHLSLMPYKRRGEIGYDEDERLVVRE